MSMTTDKVGGWGEVDGGGELFMQDTPITPVAQLIPPTRWAQGPTKLPKLPKVELQKLPKLVNNTRVR